jgi:hypothetical protein
LDTDIVGVGTGGSGIATSGVVGRGAGPDDSDGTSREFASGGPAKGENQTLVGKVGGNHDVHGSTVTVPRPGMTGGTGVDGGTGADAASNGLEHDDSFQGEISSAEADGRDQSGE